MHEEQAMGRRGDSKLRDANALGPDDEPRVGFTLLGITVNDTSRRNLRLEIVAV